jgi:hypothetical protein
MASQLLELLGLHHAFDASTIRAHNSGIVVRPEDVVFDFKRCVMDFFADVACRYSFSLEDYS